jgi:hypothetical protein
MRAETVRPTGQLHLQHAQIDPQLQLLPSIQTEDFANLDFAVLVRPIPQYRVQIQAHLASSM